MRTNRLVTELKNNINKLMLILELICIFLLFTVLTKGMFLSPVNINNLLMQSCTFALLAIGMVFLLIAGEIDISAGAAVGFLGTLAAILQVKYHLPTFTVIGITLIMGAFIGAWNGFWVAYCGIPSFIVTMASQLVFRGLTLLVGGGASIGPMRSSFNLIGQGYIPSLFSEDFNALTIILSFVFALIYIFTQVRIRQNKRKYNLNTEPLWQAIIKDAIICVVILTISYMLATYKGFPYAILLLLLITVIFSIIANNTSFGKRAYAIGGNKEAARLSGINVKRSLFIMFVQMGIITSIASIQYLARIRQATPQAGTNFEFSAITGCIVGGASTMGGVGTVAGAVIGTILVAGIDNGMSLLNLSTEWQNLVKGLILLSAVAFDLFTKRNVKSE